MIGNIRSALGDAVGRLFRHDHAAAQSREKDPTAKRLKLSAVPVTRDGDGYAEVKAEFLHEDSDLKSSEAKKSSRAGDASLGSHSLPSPPSSPKKREGRQPHSSARWFINKFRSYSDNREIGLSLDDAFDATRARPSTRDIFKKRRRLASRQTPKRPGMSQLPMPVRFTENRRNTEQPKRISPTADELPDLKRLTLETEPIISTAADKRFAERFFTPTETFDYVPSYPKTREESVNYDDRIDAILDEKQPWSLELNTAKAKVLEAQRKPQVSDEDITREYVTNLQLHRIRAPCRPLLLSLSERMSKRTISTIYANPDAVLAKAADSTPLHRHDFCRVIPKTEWLNDEIVNGVLSWLDQAVNHIGGVDDPKTQTRKCLVMTSFYYKQIKTACKNTQRTLKRKGVTKENLLKVNTILLPICEHSHWTLMVINPSKKTVAHIDSLNPRGTKSVTELALMWMKDALDDKFVATEWKTTTYDHPAQTNGYDCGVHTICNAICVAVGVDPSVAYKAVDMPALRLQMSAVLVNGGFTGELDLLGF